MKEFATENNIDTNGLSKNRLKKIVKKIEWKQNWNDKEKDLKLKNQNHNKL